MDKIFRYERALIIDDSHIDRFIIGKLIRQQYFAQEVIQMPSARLALDFLQEIKDVDSLPDIVFLDINMPDLNGFDFLQEYANLPQHFKRQNIVMLSSTLNQTDIDNATANPYIMRFVAKPLTSELLRTL